MGEYGRDKIESEVVIGALIHLVDTIIKWYALSPTQAEIVEKYERLRSKLPSL